MITPIHTVNVIRLLGPLYGGEILLGVLFRTIYSRNNTPLSRPFLGTGGSRCQVVPQGKETHSVKYIRAATLQLFCCCASRESAGKPGSTFRWSRQTEGLVRLLVTLRPPVTRGCVPSFSTWCYTRCSRCGPQPLLYLVGTPRISAW